MSREMKFCDRCGKLRSCQSIYIYRNNQYEWICDECHSSLASLAKCWYCNEEFPIDLVYNDPCGHYICKECLDERDMFFCCNCGDMDYGYNKHNVNKGTICESCYGDYLKNDLNVHDHDFKPSPIFTHAAQLDKFKCRSRNPHIGIELEIQGDNKEDFCLDLKKEFSDEKLIYLKEDGSLDYERGVEIVTQPMTYNFIKNSNLFWNLFHKIKMFSMNDLNSDCGLHFHIDRDCFKHHDSIATIDYIVNNFPKYFMMVGGRCFNNDWCKLMGKDDDEWGWFNSDYEDRYQAVNLENKNTIELRFCRSTDDYDTFMNRVKMIFNVIYFAKKYKINSIKNWDIDEFVWKMNKICFERFGSIVETNC